ncbi:MAG: hypothetical protein B5766_05275 [Candidatus Lumbricidophila eiseniae]|uniref:Uncharacterized protein n=1 Tax=Candidatus Lumbricidiphila eiseniae TaxID=1969409 RepID=A0A2A6FS24_9MICO|nr:MAG: hypothetical protein B5766_05275 [Candidatus Lumbricidophila eiseniae]
MSQQDLTSQPESKKLSKRNAVELAEPVKERAEKARARARQKVTAQDVLNRRAQKAAQRTATAQEHRGKRSRRFRTGTAIAVLLVAGVTVLVTSRITAQAAQERVAGEAHIQKLRDGLTHLEELTGTKSNQPRHAETQVENMRTMLEKVHDLATKVAGLQNKFPKLIAANPEEPGNGAVSKGFLDTLEHRKTLAPFFSTGTYLLSDQVAYSPTSIFALTTDQIDPRLQWYDRALGNGGYTWSVVSVVGSKANDTSKLDVTWLAQDDKSAGLLAWARALWSRDVEAFVSLTVGTTAYGDQQNATKSPTPSSAPTTETGQ